MTGKNEMDIATLQRGVPNGAAVHSDWSPNGSAEALYQGAVLKRNACVVLSGDANITQGLHQGLMILKNIRVAGKFMYSRQTVHSVVNVVESRLLDIGVRSGAVVRRYELSNIEEALAAADEYGGWKDYTVITPNWCLGRVVGKVIVLYRVRSRARLVSCGVNPGPHVGRCLPLRCS